MTPRLSAAARQTLLFHVVSGTEIPGHRRKSHLLAGVHGCQIVTLCVQIGIKYPRKDKNSVILKYENLFKKMHNLHMAITDLNP